MADTEQQEINSNNSAPQQGDAVLGDAQKQEDQNSQKENEPEIHTIPDEFYGAALRKDVTKRTPAPTATPAPSPVPQAPHREKRGPVLIAIVLLLLVIGGGFVYFNKDLLFGSSETVVVQTPPAPVIPSPPETPVSLSATSTSPRSISIAWEDASDNEAGFRIERRVGTTGIFVPITSLPPNSTSFLDVSVSAEETYAYRVIAMNAGGDSEPSDEVTAIVRAEPVSTISALPPTGLDADSDGLTDVEEGLYGTDPQNQDSDKDSFLDGNEVFHLYNPGGIAPVRLLDSSLVRVQEGAVGWVISFPASWTMSQATPQGTDATITSGHGETFRLEIRENPNRLSLADWYVNAFGDLAQELLDYRSKGGYVGKMTKDLMMTMIPWDDRVFLFTYNLKGQPYINFRTTFAMMLNSLQLSGMPNVELPITEPLLLEPSNATTSEL
ncbi:MAG: fibronectin type III domain-containing protein [bacterium]|nr:fibronectin type III domain-containing protein [bacterium]